MKKLISLLILISMLASSAVFTSCGSSDNKPSENAVSTPSGSEKEQNEQNEQEKEVRTEELKPSLPDGLNYNGYTFTVLHDVLGWGTYTEENLDFESISGEILSDTMYNRNRSVEEKLNFRLNTVQSKDVTGEIRNTVMAQDNAYDTASVTYGWAVGKDMLIDFNTLPNIDLTMPWWNKNCIEQMSIGGVLTNNKHKLIMLIISKISSTFNCFFGINSCYVASIPV